MKKIKFEKDIKIILNNKTLDDLKTCVKKSQPNEACGLIFGDIKEIVRAGEYHYEYIGKKFNCIESDKKSPVEFLMEDIEKLNEVFQDAAQKYDLRLISIFHSHPAGAYPSGVDTRNMKYLDNCGNNAFRNQIWTIMDAQNHELNGFIYFNEEFMQVGLEIVKD
ncbi:MAG: Mov34/MPN/PAD-1 family protein [Promethearchaeota archaeon]